MQKDNTALFARGQDFQSYYCYVALILFGKHDFVPMEYIMCKKLQHC